MIPDPLVAVVSVVAVGGCRLRTATWGSGPVEIVLLHDGLGSISQWRETPADIAAATGVAVMAYERAGHGASTPVPNGPWPTDWLHREAEVFGDLLREMAIDEPLLVGHSDGGTTALLHAAGGGACRGVVAIAAHSWVEPCCSEAIIGMRRSPHRIVAGLATHHDAPAELFEAWSNTWVSDAFATWDVRPLLASITAPTLIVQGDQDQYASGAQLTETAAAIGANATMMRLAGVGHIIHHEQPAIVAALVAEFYNRLGVTLAPTQGD
jgi:pimeloyl-ACP methyl ester carboxylesterase